MDALIEVPASHVWQHTTHTHRLILRTLRKEDLPTAHAFLREPEIAANLDFPPDIGLEAFTRLVETGACGQLYGLWDRGGTAFLGLAGLHRAGRKPGWCRLLYALTGAARGRGFAREAAMKLMEVAFTWTEAEGVTAAIHPDNAPSRSVALGLGMTRLTELELPGLEVYGLSCEAWGHNRGTSAQAF